MTSVEPWAKVKIRSILGRFLEHSRIYNFHNDGANEYWIGSADMMDRNLNRRVETLVRVVEAAHVNELDALLARAFSDEFASWELSSGNSWILEDVNKHGQQRRHIQEELMKEICP
jgi:polyphosphate kinase